MRKAPLLIATMALAVAAAALSTRASAGDPVLGALVGGGIGAAVGGPPGAAVGAVLGSIVGAESRPYYRDRGYYDRGYYAPPAPRYYEPARGYYEPGPVYYDPAPVYYAAPPVYYGSAVVYRSYPGYGYAPRYARVYERRDFRRQWDDRRWR